MGFAEVYKPITDYLWREYPEYNGWRIRSFAWEYDVCELPSVIENHLNAKFNEKGEIFVEDVEELVERVMPPEGYAFVTLQNGNTRVGFNVPASVFQTKQQDIPVNEAVK